MRGHLTADPLSVIASRGWAWGVPCLSGLAERGPLCSEACGSQARGGRGPEGAGRSLQALWKSDLVPSGDPTAAAVTRGLARVWGPPSQPSPLVGWAGSRWWLGQSCSMCTQACGCLGALPGGTLCSGVTPVGGLAGSHAMLGIKPGSGVCSARFLPTPLTHTAVAQVVQARALTCCCEQATGGRGARGTGRGVGLCVTGSGKGSPGV